MVANPSPFAAQFDSRSVVRDWQWSRQKLVGIAVLRFVSRGLRLHKSGPSILRHKNTRRRGFGILDALADWRQPILDRAKGPINDQTAETDAFTPALREIVAATAGA